MSDGLPPSEFGGKTNRNGINPAPYRPNADESLSLLYRTGDSTGNTFMAKKDEGVVFNGLIPFDEQMKIIEDKGWLEKGELDPMKEI